MKHDFEERFNLTEDETECLQATIDLLDECKGVAISDDALEIIMTARRALAKFEMGYAYNTGRKDIIYRDERKQDKEDEYSDWDNPCCECDGEDCEHCEEYLGAWAPGKCEKPEGVVERLKRYGWKVDEELERFKQECAADVGVSVSNWQGDSIVNRGPYD